MNSTPRRHERRAGARATSAWHHAPAFARPAMRLSASRVVALAAFYVGGLLVPTRAARASDPVKGPGAEPVCATRVAAQDRASLWAPPLDRIVSIRVTDVPVRDALDRVASQARVELSYSSELLPGGRRVCLALERVPVGAVLESLLVGSGLRPIVLGAAQVVLAPSRPVAVTTTTTAAPVDRETSVRRASVLDRVVVTGSPDGAAQRGSPFALDVIEGTQLTQHGVRSLGDALDLAVPGVWTWASTAGTVTARYGSIRGASSFGASAPKIYLDGIEVANPLLVTQLDASRVARVEVIRGPQGAALYGADAISGVVNILTRHDGTPTGAMQVQMASSAGLSATAFAPNDVFVQDHSVSLRRGAASRSFGLGFNMASIGAYVPGASERRFLTDADGRLVHGNAVFTGTARLSLQRANASSGPVFEGGPLGSYARQPAQGAALSARRNTLGVGGTMGSVSVMPPDSQPPRPRDTTLSFSGDSVGGQDLAQYTLGGSVAWMPTLNWTHTIITGVDGYRLRGLSPLQVASPLNDVVGGQAYGHANDADGAADRASVRLRSMGRFDVAPATLLTLTLAAEHALTRELVTAPQQGQQQNGGGLGPNTAVFQQVLGGGSTTTWYNNAGLSAQAQIAWRDRWFASAGLRGEHTTGATPSAQQSLLPMLGVAWVRDIGNSVLKVRGAYGTGIRPARTLLRTSTSIGRAQLNALRNLQAEEQSGVESGVDLLVGGRTSFHITRFDQRASGLIQPVATVVTTLGANGRLQRNMAYTLQNVGAITNRGWEIEAGTRWRTLSLSSTLSLVDSRVAQVASGYHGELRPGDRMLDVPATSLSVSGSWTAGRLTLTSTVSRAADWIGYDRASVSNALQVVETAPRDLEGAMLRKYWMRYDGVTRWRGSASWRLRGDLAFVAGGDNLLNVQRGAPDNATVLAGRTLTLGLRTTF